MLQNSTAPAHNGESVESQIGFMVSGASQVRETAPRTTGRMANNGICADVAPRIA